MGGRPVVLAISRQIGSGGAFIGQAVARRLGMKYVDREILQEACARLGVEDQETVAALEERADTFWSRIARFVAAGPPDAPYVPPPPKLDEDEVAAVEARIIREIASHEPAVIVGRGAAYILGRQPHIVRLFVHAPAAYRVAEVQRAYRLGQPEAEEMVRRADRNRARFVERLTGRSWADVAGFEIAIDGSLVSVEIAGEIVARIVEERRKTLARG